MVATSVFSKDLECFKNIHPRFSEAFEFLKKAVNEDYKDGNYEIDGKAYRKGFDHCSFGGISQ